jgi:hypothetical protein
LGFCMNLRDECGLLFPYWDVDDDDDLRKKL